MNALNLRSFLAHHAGAMSDTGERQFGEMSNSCHAEGLGV